MRVSLIERAFRRVRHLFQNLHIEASEIASILFAVAWAVPLALYPRFLSGSPYMVGVESYLSREILLTFCATLLLYQMVCLLLGGNMTIASTEPAPALPPMPSPRQACWERRWLIARREGLRAAIVVWWTMAYLLTPGMVTVYTILCLGVGAGAAWGVYRFNLHLATESFYRGYRVLRDDEGREKEAEREAEQQRRGAAAAAGAGAGDQRWYGTTN
jgi:hypothetical protein